MAGSFVEIIVTLLLILLNGVFSMSEMAFVSARKARLQQRADNSDADAQAADEPVEQEAVQQEDGSWLLDGALALEELQNLLGVEYWPYESSRGYQTLGGLAMHQLGRIPVAADSL